MAVITEITAQKKKKDRCNIFVDGAFFCGLQAETVVKYRLKAVRQGERLRRGGAILPVVPAAADE